MRSKLFPLAVLFVTLFIVSGIQVREAVSSCPVGIHDIQKSFDALACEVTISWKTDKNTTTNLVRWGTSGCFPPSYPNEVNSSNGPGKDHIVTFDVTGTGPKINFQIESTRQCGSETTDCMVAISGPCAVEQ